MKKRIKAAFDLYGWIGLLIFFLILVNAIFAICLLSFSYESDYPELKTLQKRDLSFKDLSNYFTEVANEKGAVYAFEVLKQSPMPPNIDLHLLGHIVGDILYKQQGVNGIAYCTQDFRNACSHSIVVGTLLEKGPSSFGEIADLCSQAPGGSGAYTMCYHGLGHGVLAYNEYEFSQAVKMCEKIGEDRVSVECVGGVVMEMIAGVHDREVWQRKVDKYFKKENPLYPCDSAIVPKFAKGICYTYLTPHLFEVAGMDLGNPDPEKFSAAFVYCEPLVREDRKACFGGFGKEFVVLAKERDIRAIDKMRDDELMKVVSWCGYAESDDGKADCIKASVQSLFWGGENDPKASIRFCDLAEKAGFGEECFSELILAVKYFSSDATARNLICSSFGARKELCRQELL